MLMGQMTMFNVKGVTWVGDLQIIIAPLSVVAGQ